MPSSKVFNVFHRKYDIEKILLLINFFCTTYYLGYMQVTLKQCCSTTRYWILGMDLEEIVTHLNQV